MDRIAKEVRSRVMASVRPCGTGPELEVGRLLREAGYGYRTNVSGLPGRPDVVMSGRRIAVFANGCFWHGCPHCNPPEPKSNVGFWRGKFRRNAERDARVQAELRDMGWRVFVVWECRVAEGVAELLGHLRRSHV